MISDEIARVREKTAALDTGCRSLRIKAGFHACTFSIFALDFRIDLKGHAELVSYIAKTRTKRGHFKRHIYLTVLS